MPDKPRLLLHLCCGPCATAVIERLIERFDVTAFWHNPNVQPSEEHDRRLEQARIVTREFDIDLLVDEGDEGDWLQAVAGLEAEPEGGLRCRVCQEYRLRRAAREAADRGIPHVTSTLSVSPHKPADVVNEIGARVAKELGISFVAEDFGQAGGFQRSVEVSKRLGLYRQRYCGCLFAASPERPPSGP